MMVRSTLVGHAGDVVKMGWRLCSLNKFWSSYGYYRPEQQPAFWLGVNLALALTYALIIAVTIDQVLARRKRRQGRVS